MRRLQVGVPTLQLLERFSEALSLLFLLGASAFQFGEALIDLLGEQRQLVGSAHLDAGRVVRGTRLHLRGEIGQPAEERRSRMRYSDRPSARTRPINRNMK